MGSKTFRGKFIQDHQAKDEHEKIPNTIHIAKDGKSIQILGAWLRNDTLNTTPWSPIVEKVETALARWDNAKPTIEGRKLLVQMIVGGFTQYLMQVQQMPKKIEKQLQKIAHTFIWSDKKSPVKEDMLLAPNNIGGQGLLDIQARNEAIQLMWLKSYLNLGPSHVPWADYADAIMMMNIPKTEKNIKPEMPKNIFLQTWKTYTGSHTNNKNPTEIKKHDRLCKEVWSMDESPHNYKRHCKTAANMAPHPSQ